MTWLLTATGAVVDLRFIAADSISLLDIAHHLAQLNRYTGACRRPYSVAEHSLLVVELLESRGYTSPALLQAALMHDAHEAYTSDVSSPMKQVLGDAWHAVDQRAQHAVLARFRCLAASAAHADLIKWADLTALSTERLFLLPDAGPRWPASDSHPAVGWVRWKDRAELSWLDWRQAFLDKFAELQFARGLQAGSDAVAEAEA